MLITDAWGEPVELDELDPAGVLGVLGGQRTRARGVERDKLLAAVRWCELHPAAGDEERLSLVERDPFVGGPHPLPGVLVAPEPFGGQGTPAVAAFTVEPFAAELGLTTRAATALLADALDLVHRLPATWGRVLALEVEPFKARRVAQLTNPLSQAAAADVDAAVAPGLGSCSWASIERAVAAAVAEHHPELVAERDRAGRAGWDVQVAHPGPSEFAGTSWLAATGDTLDLGELYARISQIAADLRTAGDTDPLGARKAKALGILAQIDEDTDLPGLVAARATLTSTDPAPDGAPPPQTPPTGGRARVPRTRLYLHLSATQALDLTDAAATDCAEGPVLGRVERLGPVTAGTVRDWVRRSEVTITPVIDLDPPAEGAGDIPHGLREQVRTRLATLLAAPVRDWVGHHDFTLRPVLDLASSRAVDGHDPPEDLREQVILRDGHCVHPYCAADARTADLDHIDEYTPLARGGPPGQTNPVNLAPLCRRHHRCKTARRWHYRRRPDGAYQWRGPHHRRFLVDATGTHRLTPPARTR